MEISNLYGDSSSAEIQEVATSVGKQLRVAVTKTSALGREAQSATPNLMSFSTDENSIWFNGKKYGVYVLGEANDLLNSPNLQKIQSFLKDFTYNKWEEAINIGSLVFVSVSGMLCPATIGVDTAPAGFDILLNIFVDADTTHIHLPIQYSTGSGYSLGKSSSHVLLTNGNVVNSLDSSASNSVLSAAMGKKLNDEKLAKTDVVNSLSDTSTNKALSAAQGRILNTKLSNNIIVIGTNSLPEGTTTDDQVISKALGVSSTKLYDAFKSGATIVDSGKNVIYPSLVESNHIIFNVLYLLDNTVHTKTVELKFSSAGQYSSCTVTSKKYPIPTVENSLNSNSTTNALSAAQGKALNDKISALGHVYRVKGSKTNISDVLTLTDAKVGDVWNVTNAFTLSGKPFPANTNIVCVIATSASDHNEDNWDPIGGTVDLSTYIPLSSVVDNLDSNSLYPLSANQGRQLKSLISNVKTGIIIE